MSASTTNFDRKFQQITRQVMHYEVDINDTGTFQVDGEVLKRFTESDFLASLYVPREDSVEERLASEILQSKNVVCFAGERGSGKTSALRYVLAKIREQHPSVLTLIFDIKRAWDLPVFQDIDEENAAAQFRQALQDFLYFRLFAKTGFSDRELYAWILAGPSDPDNPFEDDFLINSTRVARNYFGHLRAFSKKPLRELSRKERVECFAEILKRPEVYTEVAQALSGELTMAMLANAAVHLDRGVSKVILVIDNVDRIPANFQSVFLNHINDCQLSVGDDVCISLVAIRKENITEMTPRENVGGDHLVYVVIGSRRYRGVLLPASGDSHCARVFERRRNIAMALFRDWRLASGEVAGKLIPELTQEASEVLVQSVVASQLIQDAVHQLANGSFQSVLGIFSSFLDYLADLDERDSSFVEKATRNLAEGHLHTLLFLWIREEGGRHEIGLHDIMREYSSEAVTGEYAENADVRHLLMTGVLNQSGRTGEVWLASEYPQFCRVFRELSVLGFTIEDVRQGLRELLSLEHGVPRSLEFFKREVPVDELTESSEARLRLTIRGQQLIERVYSKVGYVFGVAHAQSDLKHAYYQMERSERLRLLLEHCGHRAEAHLKLMSLGRERMNAGWGEKWVEGYRRRFGVGRRVQIERILDSSASFFARDFRRGNLFRELRENYTAFLDQIGRGVDFEELEIERLDLVAKLAV